MHKYISIAVIVTILALIVVACGSPTPPPAPTQAPQPTAASAQPTAAPAPTQAPAPTEAPKPTEAPAGQPTAVPTPTIPPPVLTEGEGCAPNATKVVWFIGLGAGSQPNDVVKEKAWAEKFNKSQTEACVILNVVYNTGSNSYDALRAQIAAGNAPDIVGPVGKAGRASFQGAWADIEPLAKAAGYDLSQYDPKLLEFMKDEGVLVGIPFALFPSFIFYNKALFDEAQLPYPPHKVGEKYDGKDWNLETFTELAQKLTVDGKGNDATSADFDPKDIKQFGFFEQWTDPRGIGSFFEGGVPYDPKNPKNALIPDGWKKAFEWYYDGVWNKHFMPNSDYQNSDQFGKGNVFSSGNLAMSWVHTWYTCCFDLAKTNWDIAVMPAVNGKTTAKLHGDTFAILNESKNKDVAFKVLSSMVVDKDLYGIYGGMPAKVEDRPAFWASLDERSAPNKVDWTVAETMLNYPDLPNHEAWMPDYAKSKVIMDSWRTFLDQTPGLDIDKEIDKLQSDLDAVFKAAPESPSNP